MSIPRPDLCDRCCQAARYQVAVPTGTLLFCTHHFREAEAGLEKRNAAILPLSARPAVFTR